MSANPTRWGWHQLRRRWVERLVESAHVEAGDLVIDVGAGTGAITQSLLSRGARVIAVELHPRRAAHLRHEFNNRNVVVVQTDARDLRLPRRPFRVVANPPFSISVALLRRLTAPGSRLIRADIVLPRHEAHRWVSGTPPGAPRWRQDFACSLGVSLPRSAFLPAPRHDVAVLVIRRTR